MKNLNDIFEIENEVDNYFTHYRVEETHSWVFRVKNVESLGKVRHICLNGVIYDCEDPNFSYVDNDGKGYDRIYISGKGDYWPTMKITVRDNTKLRISISNSNGIEGKVLLLILFEI